MSSQLLRRTLLLSRTTTPLAPLQQTLPLLSQSSRPSSSSGRFKVSIKHDNPLTYEEAHKPHNIGGKKGWTTFNTANFTDFGQWKSEIAIQDMFIRKFMTGTWHDLFVSEVLIKRQANLIRVAGIVRRNIHPRKMYFLIGYCEEFLSYWLHSVVKLEIQTVERKEDVVFKYV